MRNLKIRNKGLELEISYRMFVVFPSCFLLFPLFSYFLVFASISLAKVKKNQPLVNFYVFLIQKIGCVGIFTNCLNKFSIGFSRVIGQL